ncbi:MAG: TIGR02147 family protein [Bdellovibrionales bacterium]
MKSVRDFDDIPQILKSILQSRKGRPLSIRELSRKLGYASDRTLGMVVQGERVMGNEMLRRISEFAKLTRKDKDYLALLALKQKQLRKGQPVDQIEKQILNTRGKPGISKPANALNLEALTSWYAFTVIELLRLIPTPATAKAIHQALRGTVPFAELETTLQALAELRYIGRTEGGNYRPLAEDEYLTTPIDIPSMTARQLHRNQLTRAAETLNEQAVHERELITKTFIVPESQIGAFKLRIREVMEELAEQFVAPQAEDGIVIQLNQQLYQQTKPRPKRGSEKS